MYGLVNQAFADFVERGFGQDCWRRLCERVGCDGRFLRMRAYPDALTVDLLTALAADVDRPAERLLEGFGEHWIDFADRVGYGALLDAAGDNIVDILLALNNLHVQVGMSYPELRPPSFRCSDVGTHSLVLHYHSERPGLTPFVIGLLHGLGRRCRQPLSVSAIGLRARGDSHDRFLVEFEPVARP